MFNFLLRRWGLSPREGSLLVQLLLLAVTILAYSVVAMAIANSLFVNYVGADFLPLAFILIGLCSIPAYGLFSTSIDRYSRLTLFRYGLLFSIAIAFGLRGLLNLDSIAVYYGLLIAVFFQWDFYNNILYPSLVIDYFAPLQYKRYAPFIGIAQAVGTLLGGCATIVLSHYLLTKDLLWSLPFILGIAFCQVIYLEKTQQPLDSVKPREKVGLIASFTSFPSLVREYPLVLLLAGSSFLLVIIYISSEFLWFNIYGESFSEEKLTSFLGLMRISISLVQVGILYGVTRPLLQKFGVANLNGVYPITTLLSFGGLLLNFKLPNAIGLHINGDALYKGINLQIHQLNYNAIPSEFRGRVRTVSDGLIYSMGLTLAGFLLWVARHYLSLGQITWVAIGLTVLLLLVRLPMGKYYARGLEQMIRADLIDLDELATEGIQLPPQSRNTIREMLTQSDRYMQLKGLELASNLGQLTSFLTEIKQIIEKADDEVRDTIVNLFTTATDIEAKALFQELLREKSINAYVTAWELAINQKYELPEPENNLLTQDKATANLVRYSNLATLTKEIEPANLSKQAQRSLIRAVSHCNNPEAIPLLAKMLEQTSDEVKEQSLKALTNFAYPEHEQLAQIAVKQLRDKGDKIVDSQENLEISIKVTAWKIIELTRCVSVLPALKWGLTDKDARVKQQVANSLAAYGELALPIARESLSSDNDTVVETAIASLGKIGTKQARDLLYDYLTPDFDRLKQTHKWQSQIPCNDSLWKPLLIAIVDYQERIIQKVLYILSCLGSSRTVNSIKQILASKNEPDLANALEALASTKHRRFIVPLIPILEQQFKPPTNSSNTDSEWIDRKGSKILLTALNSQDTWLKSSASLVLAKIPNDILTESESKKASAISSHNTSMNRLLLLKEVSLLKNLSLDELLAMEKVLISEQVLAQQTIYNEGSWGEYFYIIAEGTVKLTKQIDGQAQTIKEVTNGQYFGEIAIFDDAPRWDTAIALSNCTLLKLEKKCFLNLVSQRPHIMLEICRFLSQRLRETDKYLSVGNRE